LKFFDLRNEKYNIHVYFNFFLGIRGQYNIPNCGEKFICVDNGGTLELHGENKLAWTKLEKTINKLGDDAIFFQHSVSTHFYFHTQF